MTKKTRTLVPRRTFLGGIGATVSLASPAVATLSRLTEPRSVADYAASAQQLRLSAAVNGDVWAQRELAALYEHGVGVPKDSSEAAWWLRRAAEQGEVGA